MTTRGSPGWKRIEGTWQHTISIGHIEVKYQVIGDHWTFTIFDTNGGVVVSRSGHASVGQAKSGATRWCKARGFV